MVLDEKEVILEVKELRKKYGEEEVLKGISFTVRKGEIFSLVGPNGAGKTTTIKAILGLTLRYDGEIKIHAEKINYLAENELPYPTMSVYEYMRFYADIMDVDDEKIMEMLNLVELTAQMSKRCKNLSKGMKQRLLIARTFMNDPDFLILDEPFSGVDPEMRAKLLGFMRNYVTRTKASIFLTTHILSDVEKLSHRVAVIRDGRIISQGKVGQLGEAVGGNREIRLRIVHSQEAKRAVDKLKENPGVIDVTQETEEIIRCVYSGDISEYEILSGLFEEKIEFRIISGDVESAFKGADE